MRGVQVRNVRDTSQPTAKEHHEHVTTHRPHRSWCKFCVMGRDVNAPHRRSDAQDDLDGVPHVSMDYGFPGERDSEEQVSLVLVIHERRHKMTWAMLVPSKGGGVPLDREESSEVHRPARSQQSHAQSADNEPAIEALVWEVAQARQERTRPERPPVGESQSVKALESTKPLAQGCFNGVTNSSENHGQFCFSWPSIHLNATLGKQMLFGFPFGERAAGVAYSAATRQGNTCSKCDVAHTDSPTQHTRCMIRTQRIACSTVVWGAQQLRFYNSRISQISINRSVAQIFSTRSETLEHFYSTILEFCTNSKIPEFYNWRVIKNFRTHSRIPEFPNSTAQSKFLEHYNSRF